MKTTALLLCALLGSGAMWCTPAFAQRGMGDTSGVARQAVQPATVALAGMLIEIKTGPCEQTTGHAPIGTHLLLKTAAGQTLNIHLGPAAAVADTVAKLTAGQQVSARAFRTDKMPENNYTAQSLTFGDKTVELRDATLRPVWAGPGGGARPAAAASASQATAAAATDLAADTATPRGWGRGGRGGPPAAGGRGPWRGGRGADALFDADREVFHGLLQDHQKIRRTVTNRADGVETVTESDDPNVALAIQGHVAAMHERIKNVQPIHMRDPLFAAVFANAAKIKLQVTKTDKGVRVVETADDPFAVRLIQAHAAVVSQFVAKGFTEARQDHPVPPQPAK